MNQSLPVVGKYFLDPQPWSEDSHKLDSVCPVHLFVHPSASPSVFYLFRGEWSSGLGRYNQNWKVPGSNSTRRLTGLSSPTLLRGSCNPLVKIVENAVINIGLSRPSPREWRKVGRGTAKWQLKNNTLVSCDMQHRIRCPFGTVCDSWVLLKKNLLMSK